MTVQEAMRGAILRRNADFQKRHEINQHKVLNYAHMDQRQDALVCMMAYEMALDLVKQVEENDNQFAGYEKAELFDLMRDVVMDFIQAAGKYDIAHNVTRLYQSLQLCMYRDALNELDAYRELPYSERRQIDAICAKRPI